MDIRGSVSNTYYNYQFPPGQEAGQGLGQSPFLPPSGPSDLDKAGNTAYSGPSDQDQTTEPTNTDSEPGDTTPSREEDQSSEAGTDTTGLTREEQHLVDKLEKIDTEVRAHEMAHIAAGGQYITSGATFSYQRGPDGKNYAVGGEVSIDTSAEPGDPQATLKKMRQVRAAALAPAEPSSQDMRVAAKAASQAAKAISQIAQLQAQEYQNQGETAISEYTRQQASDAYTQTSDMTKQSDKTTFQAIA